MSKNDQSILKTTEIFNRLTNKLNFSLKNRSDSILGLDILRDSIKRDLLLLTSLFLEKKIKIRPLFRCKPIIFMNWFSFLNKDIFCR